MGRKKEEKLICSNCGQEMREKSNFCQYCGTRVEEIKKEEAPVEVEVEKVTKRATKNKDATLEKSEEIRVVYNEDKSNDVGDKTLEEEKVRQEENIQKERQEKKEKSKKYIYPVIAVVVTFALCLLAFACFYQYYLKNLVIETTKREVTVTDTGISEAVEKVYDAVVVVESYSKNRLYATGTGFVYKTDDKNAYILTNNHVIDGADEVKVVFTNNKRESVEVVGADEYSDVALLGVGKDKIISVAEIGNSEDLKLGDTAFAVGSPLDSSTYAWTVTRGVISGKNRTVAVTSQGSSVASQVMQVLQTDTAINSGNSGGPLCNSNGQVIGITNMKLASSSVEGMGFAIPIETAVRYAEKFIKGEQIAYPYIGVTVQDAVPTYRDPDASGVYVAAVEKGSPANKGGLEKGDKILKVNDVEVENSSFFKYELYKYDIGDKILITVERDGKEKTLTITLGSKGMNT